MRRTSEAEERLRFGVMHSSEVPNRLLTAGARHVLKSVSWDQTMRPARAAMIGGSFRSYATQDGEPRQ